VADTAGVVRGRCLRSR